MPVTEPHDEIEHWLAREVEPLAPPPGTFERVQRRARRRKPNQAAGDRGRRGRGHRRRGDRAHGRGHRAAGRQRPVRPGRPRRRVARRRPRTPANSTSKSAPTSSSAPATSSSTPRGGGTALSVTTSGAAGAAQLPADLDHHDQPLHRRGDRPGGHARALPGRRSLAICTSLAGTSSDGQSWYGISAPVTGAPGRRRRASSQLRFLNIDHAWAYGPQLYASGDGGRTWTAARGHLRSAGDRPGDGRETGRSRCWAAARAAGAAYASDCSRFSLYSTAEGSTSLQPVSLEHPGGASAPPRWARPGLASSAIDRAHRRARPAARGTCWPRRATSSPGR